MQVGDDRYGKHSSLREKKREGSLDALTEFCVAYGLVRIVKSDKFSSCRLR
jgi:hypothetical protein